MKVTFDSIQIFITTITKGSITLEIINTGHGLKSIILCPTNKQNSFLQSQIIWAYESPQIDISIDKLKDIGIKYFLLNLLSGKVNIEKYVVWDNKFRIV